MKQLTAVDWLQDKLNNLKPTQFCSIETIKEWVEQAKQMEKQQMIDFTNEWFTEYCEGVGYFKTPEQYYNKTYNQ